MHGNSKLDLLRFPLRNGESMSNKVKVTSANKLFFVFVVLFFSFSFLVSFANVIFPNLSEYFIISVNEIVIILIPVIVFSFYKGLDFKKVFKINKLKLLPALLIILISLPASYFAGALNNTVVYFLSFIGEVPIPQIPVPQNITELILGTVIVAVLPAICEEALNRGILLNAYEVRGTYKAIIITGIFFGIFHFDITNFLGPVVLGILLGYYAVRTNSIFAPILAHFMNNAISEFFSFYYRNEPQQSIIKISTSELLSSLQFGFVCLLVVVILLYTFEKVTRDTCVMSPSISNLRGDFKSMLTHWPVIIVLILYIITVAMYMFSIAARNLY